MVLASAIIVVASAATSRQPLEPRANGVTDEPAAAASLPATELPPLPPGASDTTLDILPTDDERAMGCHFADRGFGDYRGWQPMPVGRALIAPGGAVVRTGAFPLLIHFHGAEPMRKELAPLGLGLTLVGVDAGVGSRAYERAMEDPSTLSTIIRAAEAEVAATNGMPAARAEPIVLSAWSAGYGAIGAILRMPHDRVSAVVLLDSLYSGYRPGTHALDPAQTAPFVDAARAAAAGGPVFYLTHTEIRTRGYASTSEVATFLLAALGARATSVNVESADESYPLLRLYEASHLVVRGYGGDSRDAHCAQLHLLPTALRETVLPALQW